MVRGRFSTPTSLEAAGLPVVAVTAWQMLFEHARPEVGQCALHVPGRAGLLAGAWCRFYPRQDMATLIDGLKDASVSFGGPQELLFGQVKAVMRPVRYLRGNFVSAPPSCTRRISIGSGRSG